MLDAHKSPDPAGFGPAFSTVDHLLTFTLLEKNAHEFNQRIWVAALDF